jgi:hypothetical protein
MVETLKKITFLLEAGVDTWELAGLKHGHNLLYIGAE